MHACIFLCALGLGFGRRLRFSNRNLDGVALRTAYGKFICAHIFRATRHITSLTTRHRDSHAPPERVTLAAVSRRSIGVGSRSALASRARALASAYAQYICSRRAASPHSHMTHTQAERQHISASHTALARSRHLYAQCLPLPWELPPAPERRTRTTMRTLTRAHPIHLPPPDPLRVAPSCCSASVVGGLSHACARSASSTPLRPPMRAPRLRRHRSRFLHSTCTCGALYLYSASMGAA